MTIPCSSCQMPSSCTKDRHCNRPLTLEHAIRESKEAALALQAAVQRCGEAMAGLETAITLENMKGAA